MPHRRRYPVDLVRWEHGCNQTHTSWHSFGTFQVTTDQVQKHSETALDTPKKEGTESSFPVKMHLIPGKTPAICKFFRCNRGTAINKAASAAVPRASARCLKNIAAATAPGPTCGSGRYAPERGCHEVTGVEKAVRKKDSAHR